jgi:integrase/recombinase XerD
MSAKFLTAANQDATLYAIRYRREARKYQAILAVSWMAGLRVKEIAALKVRHVYDGAKIRQSFRLTAAMTKASKRKKPTTPMRQVFLNDRLRQSLHQWLTWHPTKLPEAPLFPSYRTGDHFSPNTMCQLLSRLYQLAEVEGATGHSGRRTFLTRLGDLKVPIHHLKNLAGHRSIVTTSLYLEANELTLLKAVNRLR